MSDEQIEKEISHDPVEGEQVETPVEEAPVKEPSEDVVAGAEAPANEEGEVV